MSTVHNSRLRVLSKGAPGLCICDPNSGTVDPKCPGVFGTAPNGGPDTPFKQGAEAAGLPDDAKGRKAVPLCTGVLDYFPDALIEVAKCSKAGNDQHNPGQPLHWAKEKSQDHADCILRHQVQRGTRDTDGILHSAKVAWRSLAQLQIELDAIKEDV